MCVWKQRSDILNVFPVPNLPAPSSALLRHIYEDWSVEWHVAGRHGYAGAGNSSYRWMNIPFVVAVGETQIHCREKAQPKLKIPYISSYFLSFSGSNYEYFICTFSSTSLTFFFFLWWWFAIFSLLLLNHQTFTTGRHCRPNNCDLISMPISFRYVVGLDANMR